MVLGCLGCVVMSIRWVGCCATVKFDAATCAFLQTLSEPAHQVVEQVYWCDLDAGHEGQHYAFGQHSRDDEWWVRWPDGADCPAGLLRVTGCPVESVVNEEGDTEVCLLPVGHSGRHNFEFDGRNIAPGFGIEDGSMAVNSPTSGEQKWTVHETRDVLRVPPWLRVDMADVTAPDGARFEHARIHLHDAAIALIVDEHAETVLMLHRNRWVIDRNGYELVGGLVDDGEDPCATARREAIEESGYNPRGRGEHLLSIEPLPGIVNCRLHIYCWRADGERIRNPSDPHESGTLTWIPLNQIETLTRHQQLLGAGTALALHAYLTDRATTHSLRNDV